jgi:acyl carrier protein
MAISSHDIASTLEGFARRQFRVADDDLGFTRDGHLYESGYVDSVGVIELIAFIESTFDVKLDDAQIFDERFTSINGISNVIDECLAGEVIAAEGAR